MIAFPLPPYRNPAVDAFVVVSVVVFAVSVVVVDFVAASVAVAFHVVAFIVAGVASGLVATVPVDAVSPLVAPGVDVVEVVTHLAAGRGCMLYSIPSSPPPSKHHSAALPSSFTAAGAATVAWPGCGTTFLPGHAFDMCPETPPNQQEGQQPFTTMGIIFS